MYSDENHEIKFFLFLIFTGPLSDLNTALMFR